MSQSDDFRKAVGIVSDNLVKLAGIVKEHGNKIADEMDKANKPSEKSTPDKIRDELNAYYQTSVFTHMDAEYVRDWFANARSSGLNSAISPEKIKEFIASFRK